MTDAEGVSQTVVGESLIQGGIRFETVTESVWRTPAADGDTTVELSLRVTNQTSVPVRFFFFDTIGIVLTTAEGKLIPHEGGRDGLLKAPTMSEFVLPSDSIVLQRRGRLAWAKDMKTLRFTVFDEFGGIWNFDGLVPGQLKVAMVYRNDREKIGTFNGFWTGDIITPPVNVTVQ